jgi:hypothetical protein
VDAHRGARCADHRTARAGEEAGLHPGDDVLIASELALEQPRGSDVDAQPGRIAELLRVQGECDSLYRSACTLEDLDADERRSLREDDLRQIVSALTNIRDDLGAHLPCLECNSPALDAEAQDLPRASHCRPRGTFEGSTRKPSMSTGAYAPPRLPLTTDRCGQQTTVLYLATRTANC